MSETTISKYLIKKFRENNVKHIFGVPGDYILNFYKELSQEKDLKTIVTCDEQGAGFAADAYARLNGLGVAVFTYGAGAFKAVNTTAQAFADRSPVIVIAGAPKRKSVQNDELVHHRVKDFDTELKVFEQVTVASAYLKEDNAFQEIDRVFETVKALSGPGYIEIPIDLVTTTLPIVAHTKYQLPTCLKNETCDNEKLHEAMAEITGRLEKATEPVVIIGLEVHRLGLQKEVQKFIEQLNVPFVTMMQSKGVLSEDHPNFLGVYEGAMCRTELREYIEGSDCLIMLGIFKTDIDLGYFSAQLDPKRTIHVRKDCTCVSYHSYQGFGLKGFLTEIDRRNLAISGGLERDSWPLTSPFKSSAPQDKKLTTSKFFEFINASLTGDTVTIADVGTSLFGAAELKLPKNAMFVGSPYYACMGFAVPGGLGIACAKPNSRAIVLVGDGAFQMTGVEVSTMLKYKLNPIIIVLNNDGYTTERIIEEGPFDNIQPWNYAKVTELFGGGKSFVATTETEFANALKQSFANTGTISVIEAKVDRLDLPAAQVRELEYQKGRR